MAAVHYHQGGFPPNERLCWNRLTPKVAEASLALGRYAYALESAPGLVLFPIFTRLEAADSSRIEGTQANVKDVLLYEAGQQPDSPIHRDDISEVINYQVALEQARTFLSDQPLSQEIILELHRTLLSGARGRDKNPGAFRAIQNWIGPPTGTIHDARYVPVAIHKLHDAIDTWLSFTLHDPTIPLVKIALMHAEFEAIHPFSDGNGRLGRILIPLMMWQFGLISEPIFNISASLESTRDEYIDRLEAVSRDDDWTGWCEFFLQTVTTQASRDLTKMQAALSLYNRMKLRVTDVGKSKYGIQILDGIFARPIFTTSDLVTGTEVPVRAAQRILTRFKDILSEVSIGRGQNPSVFLFTELLSIAEGGTAFE